MKINTITDPENGQEVTGTICPTCGDLTVRLKSSEHGFFWKCMHESCGVMLLDDNGKPAPVAECPICQCRSVARHESAKKPGMHYHVCAACGQFYGDNNGEIGGPFGYDPVEVTQDLREALLHNTLAALASAMLKNGLKMQEARRRISVLEREGYIVVDPTILGVGFSIAESALAGPYI